MLITRRSPFTGESRTEDLPITVDQILAYESGIPLQHAFPNLDADQREFFKTGITNSEWDTMFAPFEVNLQEEINENDLQRF
jgi:hypothetical protein